MRQFSLLSVLILVCLIAFLSCERTENVIVPVIPDTQPPDPVDMMTPDQEIEMMTMMEGSPVVINEFMAGNSESFTDPQGDYDDWLELHNLTDSPVVLTGKYLSDKEDNPTKWEFPDGTEIPANGYLIVWCDEDHDDENATEGLHSNFKLSKGGEIILLVDTDANGNTVLDMVIFGEQEDDVAFGRWPNATGDFQFVQSTPGAANKLE